MQFTHLRDVFERTQENLKFIEEAHKQDPREAPVYEVTQLINSLVLPLELLVNRDFVTEKLPSDLRQQGRAKMNLREPLKKEGEKAKAFDVCLEIRTSPASKYKPESLPELAQVLRNAAAHFNIRFSPDKGQITRIELWNTDPNDHKVITWQGTTTVTELKTFVHKLLDFVKESPLGDISIIAIQP
jgi:HEPN pEK499 p136